MAERIAAGDRSTAESPLERVERQIRDLKSLPEIRRLEGARESLGPWAQLTETEKLSRLETLDWRGVAPLEKLCVIEGAVDLNRVSPQIQRVFLGELRDHVLHPLGARLPSPAEIIDNPKAWQAGHGSGDGHETGPDRGR